MFEEAKKTFSYYMEKIWRKTGFYYDSDNKAEWDYIFESMETDIRILVKELVKREIEKQQQAAQK